MGKRQRKRSNLKRGQAYKNSSYQISQVISFSLAIIGFIILAWCGFERANPFLYASYLGAGLVISATLITVFFDKSKWSRNRKDYTDDLGGHDGGAY